MNGRVGVARVLAYKHVPKEKRDIRAPKRRARARETEFERWNDWKDARFVGEIHETNGDLKKVSATRADSLGFILGKNLDGRRPATEELVETLGSNIFARWNIPANHEAVALNDSELNIVRDEVRRLLAETRGETINHTQ